MTSPSTIPTPTPADEPGADAPDRAAVAPAEPKDGGERRDLQRAALHDLVVLLTESAARFEANKPFWRE